MGFALHTTSRLAALFQRYSTGGRSVAAAASRGVGYAEGAISHSWPDRMVVSRPANRASQVRRPTAAVRVWHLADTASPASAGRLRISGRMADVCAELDRLAAGSEPRATLRV